MTAGHTTYHGCLRRISSDRTRLHEGRNENFCSRVRGDWLLINICKIFHLQSRLQNIVQWLVHEAEMHQIALWRPICNSGQSEKIKRETNTCLQTMTIPYEDGEPYQIWYTEPLPEWTTAISINYLRFLDDSSPIVPCHAINTIHANS